MSTDRRLHIVEGITVGQVGVFRSGSSSALKYGEYEQFDFPLPDGTTATYFTASDAEHTHIHGLFIGKPIVKKGVYHHDTRADRTKGWEGWKPGVVPTYELGSDDNGDWHTAMLEAVHEIVYTLPVIDEALIAKVEAALGGPEAAANWKSNWYLDSEDERTPVDFLREHMGKRIFSVAW